MGVLRWVLLFPKVSSTQLKDHPLLFFFYLQLIHNTEISDFGSRLSYSSSDARDRRAHLLSDKH